MSTFAHSYEHPQDFERLAAFPFFLVLKGRLTIPVTIVDSQGWRGRRSWPAWCAI
jgi:hypothetical protein